MQSHSLEPPDSETDRRLLDRLGSVGVAFFGGFTALRPGQRKAIEPVLRGVNTLLAASTASGKTEAIVAPLVARVLKLPATGRRTRILIVTPTRALVNDLRRRLTPAVEALGWRCGAQTSDHRERESQPHILITTPESFDSTLINGFIEDRPGHPVDHLLSGVDAVFLDEAHFYYGSPRGDQVLFLLERLRRLRTWAVEKKVVARASVQICGASATAGCPNRLAEWLLGKDAIVVSSSEKRAIEVLSDDCSWITCGGSLSARELVGRLPAPEKAVDLAQLILDQRSRFGLRKWLVFAPSRSACDQVGLLLSEALQKRAEIWVGAHHGSLTKEQREYAEESFAANREAVLVATATLEVGVDIGDVDVVCQIGCPPSVASLLQRIGRGNRRERDKTRLAAFPRNEIEALALAGLIAAAVNGAPQTVESPRHWSVLVQQTLSFIRQSHGAGRTKDALADLAVAAWPLGDTRERAVRLLDGMVSLGALVARRGTLHSSEELFDRYSEGGNLFANFDTAGAGVDVVDAVTGEVLANVAGVDAGASSVVIGGKRLRLVSADSGKIEVSGAGRSHAGEATTVRYASKRMPISSDFADAVRASCGFGENAAPLLRAGNQFVWFHFSGELWEAVLCAAFPTDLFLKKGIPGIATTITVDAETLRSYSTDTITIRAAIERVWRSLSPLVEKGRFFAELPRPEQRAALGELVPAERLSTWLQTRTFELLPSTDPRHALLSNLLTTAAHRCSAPR